MRFEITEIEREEKRPSETEEEIQLVDEQHSKQMFLNESSRWRERVENRFQIVSQELSSIDSVERIANRNHHRWRLRVASSDLKLNWHHLHPRAHYPFSA